MIYSMIMLNKNGFFFLETSDISPAILWETAKVVMRGKMNSPLKKKERSKKRARASRRSQKVRNITSTKGF